MWKSAKQVTPSHVTMYAQSPCARKAVVLPKHIYTYQRIREQDIGSLIHTNESLTWWFVDCQQSIASEPSIL